MPNILRKIVLVTGGGEGIGRAIAERLASAGAHVIVTDIHEATGASTAAKLRQSGHQADFFAADVADAAQVRELLRTIASHHGRLDAAVNNAGISGPMARTHDIDDGTFGRIIDVNLKGVFLCMKHELSLMLEHHCGSIVNIASVAGVVGEPNFGAYSAAKHGGQIDLPDILTGFLPRSLARRGTQRAGRQKKAKNLKGHLAHCASLFGGLA